MFLRHVSRWAAIVVVWTMLLMSLARGINATRLPTDRSILWKDHSSRWTLTQVLRALYIEPWQPDYRYHAALRQAEAARRGSNDKPLGAALDNLHRAMYWQPLDPRFSILKGRIHTMAGDLAKAAQSMENALSLDPQNPYSFVEAGLWRYEIASALSTPQAETQALLAELALREAIELNPALGKDETLILPLVDLLWQRGASEEAEKTLEHLSKRKIQNLPPRAWLSSLVLLCRLNQGEKAMLLWEERWRDLSLELDEIEQLRKDLSGRGLLTPGERYIAARVLQRLGNWEEAAEILSQLTREYPETVRFHLAFGEMLERMGQKDKALSAYERVLELEPRNPAARAYLIRHYGNPSADK